MQRMCPGDGAQYLEFSRRTSSGLVVRCERVRVHREKCPRSPVGHAHTDPYSVKFRGLEVFGVLERAQGKASAEVAERIWKQYAVDTVYRFLPNETLFVGARYNRAHGELAGITGDVGADRWQVGGGWFITPNVLAKAEYVNQKYFGYPTTNIKNGGTFNGMMLEGVIAF